MALLTLQSYNQIVYFPEQANHFKEEVCIPGSLLYWVYITCIVRNTQRVKMSHREMCLPNNVRDKVNTEEYNRTLILRKCSHFFFFTWQKIIYNSNNLSFKFLSTKGSQTIGTQKILLLVFLLKANQCFVVQCHCCLR